MYGMYPRPKADEPCESYFGNVCTGFGNDDQTCLGCGWERYDHPSERTFLPQLGDKQ